MLPKEFLGYLREETSRIARRQKREDHQAERYREEQEKKRQLDVQAEAGFLVLWKQLDLFSYLEAIRKKFGGVAKIGKTYTISPRSESHSRGWPHPFLSTPEFVPVGLWIWRRIALSDLPLPPGVKYQEGNLRRSAGIGVALITSSYYPRGEVTAGVEISGGGSSAPFNSKRGDPNDPRDSSATLIYPYDSSFERKMWHGLHQALEHRVISWVHYYDPGGGSKS